MKKILIISAGIDFKNQSNTERLFKDVEEVAIEVFGKHNVSTINLNHHYSASHTSILETEKNIELINYVKDHEIIFTLTPTYNLSISGMLKNFIDHIALPRHSFIFENGIPKGLMKNKYINLFIRGGFYKGTPSENILSDEKYLDTIWAFIGWTKIDNLYAEGFGIKNEKGETIYSAETWFKDNKESIINLFKNNA